MADKPIDKDLFAKAAQSVEKDMLGKALRKLTGAEEPQYTGKHTIERKGTKMIIPEKMSNGEAVQMILDAEADEETKVNVSQTFQCYPSEGAVAFWEALDRKFGYAKQVSIPGFFGSHKPSWISVALTPTESVSVPWGRIELHGLDGGFLETRFKQFERRMIFELIGQVKKKYRDLVLSVFALTAEILKAESIFHGKAWEVTFPSPTLSSGDPDPSFDPFLSAPKPIDVSRVVEGELIFSRKVQEQINANIFTPLRKIARCREFGVPLKRGVLLAGPFGTGKTLTAAVAAKIASENKVTFLRVINAFELGRVIEFARQLNVPVMIFVEDLDKVVESDNGELQNIIDGLTGKDSEIMLVMTTNYMERIPAVLRREGRLDVTIYVDAPDAEAAGRLIRLYGRDLIPPTEDLTEVSAMLTGEIPARIREAVERAKLAALSTESPSARGAIKVTATALRIAAQALLDQKKLWAEQDKKEPTIVEKAMGALGSAFVQSIQAQAEGRPVFMVDTFEAEPIATT